MATSNEDSPTSKPKGKSTPPTIDDQQTLADRRKSDRARMPPPASTIMFAPPPSPTYTTRQVLAYQVQMPSPTSVPRRGSVTINHPVQSSIAPEFRWIVGSSLQRIRKLHISEFRSRIEMMDCVKFDDPMALPWHASPMLSEGCVTSYLDAQVLGAAWQVVLQMVPQERDYDLQMVKQATITNETRAQTYSVVRGGKCEDIAILELRAPGVVKGMLTMIESSVRGVQMEPSDDWKAVTRQLRMYATVTKVRDVLVMDEYVGIYFRFPSDPTQVDEVHEYLFASTERGQGFDSNLRLSIRELVVFVLLSGLDRNNVRLRDFSSETPSMVLFGPNTKPYHNVLSSDGVAPEKKRRSGPSANTQPQSHKKGKGLESDYKYTFDRMALGAKITLALVIEESPIIVGEATPVDFGLQPATNAPPLGETGTRVAPPPTVTVTVERILKKNVAVVTSGPHRFVAKMFPPDPDRDPEIMRRRELDVYEECVNLQGICIPYLIGVYCVVAKSPRYNSLVMIIEYIGYGDTISQIVEVARGLTEQDEIDRVNSKLAVLKASAKKALESIHHYKVAHGDVAGRNMIVQGDDVVIVDFGYSMVLKDNPEKFESRRDNDMLHLDKAFEVKRKL